MEKHVQSIFYVDITEEEPGRKQKELPIYKLKRLLPYEGGQLQIYLSHLPRKLLKRKSLRRKNSWLVKLANAVERAQVLLEHIDNTCIIFSEELAKQFENRQQLPMVLYAVCLKQKKQMMKTVTITLPEEAGFLQEENVRWLLAPYLKRINTVVFLGEETYCANAIEDYLYEEYGTLVSYSKKPEKNTIWIDLGEKSDVSCARYAAENGIYHLDSAEVLKFLDTITKNGYTTEVD